MKWSPLLLPLLLLCLGDRPALAETLLGVHWGSVDANETLLQLGGYQTYDRRHANDLSLGGDAILNEAVMKQIENWYKIDKEDRAGAAFYFSTHPTDSLGVAKGKDLLIVEMEDSIVEMKAKDLKALSDSGQGDKLPSMVSYTETWSAIPRVPRNGEAAIRFRPPRPGDAKRMFEQLKTQSGDVGTLRALGRVGELIQSQREAPAFSKASEYFLHQYFFDEGAAVLETLPSLSTKGFELAEKLFDVFEEVIPQDARTVRIAAHLLNQALAVESGGDGADWDRAYRFSAKAAPYLSDADAKRVIELDFTRTSFRQIPAMLEIYDKLKSRMTPAEQGRWTDRIRKEGLSDETIAAILKSLPHFDRQTKHLLGELIGSRGIPSATPLSQGIRLVDPLKDAMLPLEYQRLVESVTRAHLSVDHGLGQKDLEWLRANMSVADLDETLLRFATWSGSSEDSPVYTDRPNSGNYPRVIQHFLQKPLEMKRAFLERFPVGAGDLHTVANLWKVLGAVYRLPEGTDRSEWLHLMRAQIAKQVEREKTADDSAHFQNRKIQEAIRLGATDEVHFRAFVLRVVSDFPELMPFIVKELRGLARFENSQIPYSQIIFDLERPQPANSLENRLGEEYKNLPPRVRNELSKVEFVAKQKAVLENIHGSRSYSELSRLFSLIDPLLVSEDLRGAFQANAPQNRFDIIVPHSQGGSLQLPTWLNHKLAWEHLSLGFDELSKADRLDSQFLGFRWAKTLIEASAYLMQTNVDGCQSTHCWWYTEPWDRKKYATHFSESQVLSLSNPDSNQVWDKFFTADRGAHGVILRFKSHDELKNIFPDLDLGRPSENQVQKLLEWIVKKAYEEQDPIKRAAKILDLLPKVHPISNGNGRLARAWATQELMRAGYPMPVGLPVNDFMMSEKHLELEVRRAIKLGSFWKKMLDEAQRDGVDPETFFQTRFKGSAFEGLLHFSPAKTIDLEDYVGWLESQRDVPSWGRQFMEKIAAKIDDLAKIHGGLEHVSEVVRQWNLETVIQDYLVRVPPPHERRKRDCVGGYQLLNATKDRRFIAYRPNRSPGRMGLSLRSLGVKPDGSGPL